MLELFTMSMGMRFQAYRQEIQLVDTTVKSGFSIFAPSWDIVLGHKNGTVSDEEYTKQYLAMLNDSWKVNRDKWLAFIAQDGRYGLACYCTKKSAPRPDLEHGVFCHRFMLVKTLVTLCEHRKVPVQYFGEYEP